MNESNLAELSRLFLALSDGTRLRLISLMADGEVSVGYLATTTGESQPKVSRHLAYLRTAGLVNTRRDGKNIFYGISLPETEIASRVLTAVLGNGAVIETLESMPEPPNRNLSDETYMNDYKPQEIEVYLL